MPRPCHCVSLRTRPSRRSGRQLRQPDAAHLAPARNLRVACATGRPDGARPCPTRRLLPARGQGATTPVVRGHRLENATRHATNARARRRIGSAHAYSAHVVRRRRCLGIENARRRVVRGSVVRCGPSSRAAAAHPGAVPIVAREFATQGSSRPRRVAEGCGVKRVTGLDWPVLALAGCLLALSAAGAATVNRFDDPKIGVFLLLQAVPYAIATWLVLRGAADRVANGRALATILLVGIAMRCLLLPGTPVSNDLFRYIWDGRVQAAGINPYFHVPSAEVLTPLRDGAIYPYINRADYAPTIYPPTSQIVFYLVTRISEAPIAMKAAMLAFEALAVWAMLRLLALRGLPRSRILLYAWHPLPVWE